MKKMLGGVLNKEQRNKPESSSATPEVIAAADTMIQCSESRGYDYEAVRAFLESTDRSIHNGLAKELIRRGNPRLVSNHLWYYFDLENSIADSLIAARSKQGLHHVFGDIASSLDHFADPDLIARKIFTIKPTKELNTYGGGSRIEKHTRAKALVLRRLFSINANAEVEELLDSVSKTERNEILAECVDQIGSIVISNSTLERKIFGLPKRFMTKEFAQALLESTGGGGKRGLANHLDAFPPAILPSLIRDLAEANILPYLDELLELPITFTQEIALIIAKKEFIPTSMFKRLGVTDPKAIALAILDGFDGDSCAHKMLVEYRAYGFATPKELVDELTDRGERGLSWNNAYNRINADLQDAEAFEDAKERTAVLIQTRDGLKQLEESIEQRRGVFRPNEYIQLYFGREPRIESEGYAVDQELTEEQQFGLLRKHFVSSELRPALDAGVEVFGVENMMAYLNKTEISRHDALHAFNSVLGMYKDSKLSANAFYNQILKSAAADTLDYENGNALFYLNEIAGTFNPNLEDIRVLAEQYPKYMNAADIAAQFPDMQSVFSSWAQLKKYHEFAKQAENAAFFIMLDKEPNPNMREYIKKLALHPYSAVDMRAAMEFYQEPEKFLDRGDGHTPLEVHNRKKPSNLTNILNLDLTAENMRDALVNGDIDKIAAFAPYQVRYEYKMPLRKRMHDALGSFKGGVPGKAVDSKKLFSELQKAFKESGTTLQAYLAGAEIGPEVAARASELLEGTAYGVPAGTFPAYSLVASMNLKSDAEAVVAGNDTACCMPFGSGKNNVYTFNPNCGLFTIQLERPGERPRTIAQSVVTKDMDIGRLVSDVAEKLNGATEHLDTVLPENVLRSSPSVLSCDSAETSPNFRTEEYLPLIQQAYKAFMEEYLAHEGQALGLDQRHFLVSTSFSLPFSDVGVVPNTYAPRAPVAYSDKLGDTVHSIEFGKKSPTTYELSRREIIRRSERLQSAPEEEAGPVRPLTYQDSLGVAYIESKAYAGNTSVMEYLSGLENTLIAKEISNAHKNRSNLCFKYETDGIMRGYLIAYEGIQRSYDDEGSERSEKSIYIADFAVKESDSLGGARAASELLKFLMQTYKREYLDTGNMLPITARMREETSYRLMKRQLSAFERSLGVTFDVEEQGAGEQGGETFHQVKLTPRRTRK